jgi:ATP-dependent exoDNAse (exonuclease V) beta subunit
LRVLLLESVTEDDFREIVRALVKRAKDGQLAAIHELLTRLLGKPAEVSNPDTLDIEELHLKAERDGASLWAVLSGGGK